MIDLPRTIEDIDNLILNKIQEDLHLDYKQSSALDPSKKDEIAKDVSAFANSDGGVLIYGIVEENNLPVSKDDGVDHKKISRERLEQIISSNITPRIDDIEIVPIPLSDDKSIFVVKIPKSNRAPHQSSNKKYHKRFNFLSVAMEDYEINDVRQRQTVVLPLINIDVETKYHGFLFLKVSNTGAVPAYDVIFTLPENLVWLREGSTPKLLINGTKYFPPGRTFRFLWNRLHTFLHPSNEADKNFEFTVSYLHPQTGQRLSDVFYIDLEDYRETMSVKSDVEELKDVIKTGLNEFLREIKTLNRSIDEFKTIAGSTGLDLSLTTLKNLKNIYLGNGDLEKIDPDNCDYHVFKEVLGIDYQLAHDLDIYFSYTRHTSPEKKLEDVKGITPEIIEKLKEYFIIED